MQKVFQIKLPVSTKSYIMRPDHDPVLLYLQCFDGKIQEPGRFILRHITHVSVFTHYFFINCLIKSNHNIITIS